MAATCGRYIQTVPLDPDESYELGGLTRDAEDKHCSTGISSQNRPVMSRSSA